MAERQYPICVPPENEHVEALRECPSYGELLGNAALIDLLPTGGASFDYAIPHEDSAAGHNVRYNLDSSSEGLGVHVPIYAHPSDVGDEDFERMATGIDATWNDQFEVCRNGDCAPVTFKPEFRHDDPKPANVIVDGGSGPTTTRRWQTEDVGPIDEADRLRDRGSVELAAGHEFGHLIGAPDEYWKTYEQFVAITGREPLETELTSRGFSNRDNGMGRTGEPMLPRHLEHLAEWVEGLDPEGGTVTIEPRADAECTLYDGD